MDSMKIPFFQSFQTGRAFRKGDPHSAAWKFIKRVGTLDNLRRIAVASKVPPTLAEVASLRIRQALELHEASLNTSTLTRPLLLYYSALNLVRGALLARHGEAGATSHGMRYSSGIDLLNSAAEITKGGTFPRLIESIWAHHAATTKNQSLTLKQALSQIPELRHEFCLIGIIEPLIAEVHVEAYINADTELKYILPSIKPEEFSSNWQSFLPWLSDKCDYKNEFTLVLKSPLETPQKVQNFCNTYLWRDLQWRQDPVWFDQITRPGETLLPRVAAYLAGLFILSNVSRYEPEALMPAIEPTDLAFVIDSFLDCAERSIPLLVIELLEGPTYFI